MYNLQAIIRRNINNTITQFERIGYIANNVTNYNTTAYKAERFEQFLREDGSIDGAIRTNVKQGSIRLTHSPYDIAIDGEGYIPVVSPDGEVQYTRDGSLKRSANGYLVTFDDWMVGDGIRIPANSYKFEIKPNGDVINYDTAGSLPTKIGTIPIVQFNSPESLDKGHNNKMKPTEDSGEPMLVKGTNTIKQNAIEVANVSLYNEINDLMRMNTSLTASLNLMKVVDDMYNKSINLTQG